MKMETLKQQILTAKGDVRAELVLKNARVINVFTNEIEQADVAIRQGVILGVGHYTGETELDLQGKYVCPGLVDGHIHIESSIPIIIPRRPCMSLITSPNLSLGTNTSTS